MATISFLWHLHQPSYRTADGVSHAPWAMLHAGGAYTTLAKAVESTGGAGHVINIVPTLLEQLVAYAAGTVSDPVINAITTPVGELTPDQRNTLASWAFHVNPRQFARYPRLAELEKMRSFKQDAPPTKAKFSNAELRDLQVLFVLAQAGEQAWTDDRLAPLHAKAREFNQGDHDILATWLSSQATELIELWLRIADFSDVEIATSPFAHPIMPLLIDSNIVAESWAPHPAPRVPRFRHPEDASWQLETGIEFMAEQGFETFGCWPPEGSVSDAAVELYGKAGVRWLVTDEGILERSLDKPLREGENTAPELYRPWKLASSQPTLFFRDRHVSDAIGFQYGRWEDESQAAEDLVRKLDHIASDLPDEATITIALDGENPWLYYPQGGGKFLRELMHRINDGGSRLRPSTLARAAETSRPETLDRLHPGSWINSIFATWIGHPEKTAAWEMLTTVREALSAGETEHPSSLLLAEASDWFWWLGDDNPTELAPLYDEIFRRHLADACAQAKIPAPVDLDRPLKTGSEVKRPDAQPSELRHCAVKQTWTIIAPGRKQRNGVPHPSGSRVEVAPEDDPFAPGNEHLTAAEILRLPSSSGDVPWKVRVFANAFPALRVEGEVERQAVGLNDTVSGVGAHEVIVETPSSDLELADLEIDDIALVFSAFKARLEDLRRDPRLRYVLIFKNKGKRAGSSVAHAHSQLIATPNIPTAVISELSSCREHFSRHERCLFCDLIRQETRLEERICIENDHFLAMAPFAAASPFETWILPKKHCHDFSRTTSNDFIQLAEITRDLLRRVNLMLDDPPYNLVLHTAPNPHPRPGRPDYWSTIEHDYHWHIEFAPRSNRMAGFEWGSGYSINPVPPEESARLIREADGATKQV